MTKRKTNQVVKLNGGLNPQQELFCQLYASNREFFGNGMQSYLEAYDLDSSKWKSAKANAHRLLTKDYILKRIDELLEIYINDQVVDKELGFVILQKADLGSKVAAIREYNKLKNRVSDKPAPSVQELHLHLHKNEKVVQIIKKAEDQLLQEIEGEIND